MRNWLTIILVTCVTGLQGQSADPARTYEGTTTLTERFQYTEFDYTKMCCDLHIERHMPKETELTGKPGSYVEWVSDHPDYSVADFERTLLDSGGKLYLDTASRDYTRFWYNESGQLERYVVKRFGDMLHSECRFKYRPDGSIAELHINDLVTEALKYLNSRIEVAEAEIVLVRFNIAALSQE